MSSTELLAKLAAYVPMPVSQAIFHRPQTLIESQAGRFPAAVLYTDISGFTALSELLSEAGATGAEEITQLINEYFTRVIETVQTYRGQVVKFSGDALTVIFPADTIPLATAVRYAATCALTIQARLHETTQLQTSHGPVSLSMKAGLGAGSILACHVGGILDRWEYVVGGDPLVQVAMAEQRAAPGQVILSPQAWQQVSSFFTAAADDQGFVNLDRMLTPLPALSPLTLNWETLDDTRQALAEAALQRYIPGAIKARFHDQAEWLAELRRMTILFVGLGGIDYERETAPEKLQTFVRAAQEAIYRLEGSLGKVVVDDKGTVLLVLFGAPPISHEDDTYRAVTCALKLQQIAQDQRLHMSIGVTEGMIFAGPIGAPTRKEYTVIGDQVNLAARLMQFGRGGSIIISETVKQRIGERFIVRSLGQLTLKGKGQTLPAYQVEGEEGAQFQFVTRYFSQDEPLIGRKAELEQVRRLAGRARAGRRQTLLLEGELGLGKSRLAAEMVREWLAEGGAAYGSRCSHYSRQIPYQAWQEILAALYGLRPTLSAPQQLAHLANAVDRLPPPADQPDYWTERLPLLAEVLGLEAPQTSFSRQVDGRLRRNNTFALIEALLRCQTDHQPLLILLEDIHWADELSLALAAHLADALRDAPILLALVYRPAPIAAPPALQTLQTLEQTHTIRLEPLSSEESLDLITLILGERSLPPEAQSLLLKRGQGNPFFLQEITHTLLNSIDKQQDRCSKIPETFDLPSSLQDAILTRVDRLPDMERLTLKVASVIGANFEQAILSAVHPVVDARAQLAVQLADLEHQKLIRLESPGPKWEYTFHNLITQEVVYEGLLLSQRRQLHTTIGDVLEQFWPDAYERLAYHYSRSNRTEKSLVYLKEAARRAQRDYANQTAIAYLSETLTVLAQLPTAASQSSPQKPVGGRISPDYWDVLLDRARLYNLTGQRENEAEDLGTLGLLAEALDDDRRRALAAKQWTHFYEAHGDLDSGLEMIERAVMMAHQAADEPLIGAGFSIWGRLLYVRGDYQRAAEYLRRALTIARRYNDQQAQAECLHNQGLVSYYQADYEQAQTHFQAAIDLWRGQDDRPGLSKGLRDLGRVYYQSGRFMAAHQTFAQAQTIHRAIGDWAGEARTRLHLGRTWRSLGNFQEARQNLETALAMHRRIEDRRGIAESRLHLGFLLGRQGDYSSSLEHLAEALLLIRELNDPWLLARGLKYYAWILTEAGKLIQGRDHIQEALHVERDFNHGLAQGAIAEKIALLGQIALRRKDLSLAETCAQHAWSFIAQRGITGLEHPTTVFLTCYQIFQAGHKVDRARAVLVQSQEYLAEQAIQIDDPALRRHYLESIPENRTLQALTDRFLQEKLPDQLGAN